MVPKEDPQLVHGNELFGHSGKKEIKAAVSCHLLFTRLTIIKKSEGSKEVRKGGPYVVGGIAKV